MVAHRLDKGDWTRILSKIYTLLDKGSMETSRAELASTIDEPVRAIQSLLAVCRHLGIFELTYVRHASGIGRASRYDVKLSYEQAVEKLEGFGWDEIVGWTADGTPLRLPGDRVALARDGDGGELRAVVGTDGESPFTVLRPLRFNEAQALVEATRQYLDRIAFVDAQVIAARERGIKVDRSAFKVARDTRMDHIALVLPFIEGLEKQVANLGARLAKSGDVGELRDKLQQTEIELRRCREARCATVSAEVLRDQQTLDRQ